MNANYGGYCLTWGQCVQGWLDTKTQRVSSLMLTPYLQADRGRCLVSSTYNSFD